MKQWSPRLRKAAPWLVLLVLLAGLAAVRGLAACYNIQYEITNGDFQNYNPVRHLLAGQVPYRDFTVYLGAGELYSVGALLLVLGNSFGRSMFCRRLLHLVLLRGAGAGGLRGGHGSRPQRPCADAGTVRRLLFAGPGLAAAALAGGMCSPLPPTAATAPA